MGEIKTCAIRFKSLEIFVNKKAFLKISDESEGFIGVHPEGKWTFALFKSPEQAVKAFKKYEKEFKCKLVRNACYIDEKYVQ